MNDFETTLTVTDPTADRTITFPNASITVSGVANRFVGSFTRDTTLATGTQAVTGVGFQPTAIVFFTGQGSSAEMSIGFTDCTNERVMFYNHNITASTFDSLTTLAIRDVETSLLLYDGEVDGTNGSCDTDGFTVSWTRTSTPSGTLTVQYLAIR